MRRPTAALLTASLVLAGLAGCGMRDDGCDGMDDYRDLSGQTVTVLTEAGGSDELRAALEGFKGCTGAEVSVKVPRSGRNVATQLNADLSAGHPPQVALMTHDQFRGLAQRRALKPAAPSVMEGLKNDFPDGWRSVMTVGGTTYGVPVDTEMKSVVWYSPSRFKAKGWDVPSTWEDLMGLTRSIARSGLPSGAKPWCAGFAAAEQNSGWPGTDWLEDALLRSAGTDVYDSWVDHRIAFNDPKVVRALGSVSAILRDPQYVNGGFGPAKGIAETPFIDAGLPILSGECYLHRQGNLYGWPQDGPEKPRISPDGDVWAFYLPPMKGTAGRPVLGTGSIAATLSDQPVARALQTYLTTPAFAAARARVPGSKGWISPNRHVDPDAFPNDLDREISSWLSADDVRFRYDGSDEMPDRIARNVFWKAMVRWVSTDESDAATLTSVEKEWP